jgi:superfamily II DNA or RNA helicase
MKYTITRNKRRGYIKPIPVCPSKLATELFGQMSYIKKGVEFMPNPSWGHVKLYKNKTGSFPWGFIGRVKKIFDMCDEEYEIKNPLIVDCKDFKSDVLRDYQVEAVKAIIDNDGGIISMPTGGGKTITMIEFLKNVVKSDSKFLVIVPTLDIKQQWESKAMEQLTVMTYQSIKKKSQLEGMNVVIFDECHHVASKVLYKIAMACSESILIGCSATVKREDGEDLKIEAALGPIVHNIERRDLIDRGWLCDAEVKYISLDEPPDMLLDYQEAYEKFVVNNTERNDKIVDIAISESKDRQVLVLVQRIEHGLELYDRLKDNGACFFNGQLRKVDRLEMFKDIKNMKYGIVIATSIFDEGVDVHTFGVLILAVGGKSSIKVAQRVGRLLRMHEGKQKATIYDFIDNYKWLRKHYQKRRMLLEKDFEVTDIV